MTSKTTHSVPFAIIALILGGIATACTESTIVGLLPEIGRSLGVVDESQLSFAITLYMAGVVVGAPIFTVVLVRMNRKRLLMTAVATQVVGNLLTVFAPSFGLLMVGRFISGLPHGAIYGLMALVGAYMAPPGKVGRTVSLTFLGSPIANLAMVPLMTFIGQRFGHGVAFAVVAVMGSVAIAAMAGWLPDMRDLRPTNPRQEMGVFRNRQVMLTLLAGLIGFVGLYGFLSYMALSVERIAGLDPSLMPFIMMTTGFGSLTGVMVNGHLSDRFPEGSFPAVILGFAIVLALAPAMMQTIPTAFIEVFLVTMFGSGAFPQAMQVRLINHAGDAQNFAASLNHAALCLSNGLGSIISSVIVGAGIGGALRYAMPPVFCAIFALVGLTVLGVAVYFVKSGRDTAPSAASTKGAGAEVSTP